jgi:hypothetical protein
MLPGPRTQPLHVRRTALFLYLRAAGPVMQFATIRPELANCMYYM